MKIKRFFAKDIRQALRQVRETLGADAVILSNKPVDGGVELVAAMDYDASAYEVQESPNHSSAEPPPANVTPFTKPEPESAVSSHQPEPQVQPQSRVNQPAPKVEWSQDPMLVEMREEMKSLRRMVENELSGLSWREMSANQPHAKELLRRLISLDLSPDICKQLVESVGAVETIDQAWRKALYFLATEVATVGDSLLDQGGVVALIGPTGVGKTTTIAKLAARYALRHGNRHVALISTDNYRIGAQEQLNTYARILDVPIRSAANAEELSIALNCFADKRLVLIDTAGMSQRDIRLSEQLSMLYGDHKQVRCFLTLSATTQQSAQEQAIRAFSVARPEACVLTKVDEAATLGGTLSALIHSAMPVAFMADGQKVPEDIHLARAHTLVSRAATLSETGNMEYGDEYLAMTLGGVRANAHV
ncbi:MAG: flagellar biosynthesis protein FlhF [Chromatiales bacterium]|nr:flagellar biosynthesis protein FlhF [Chromatiales bacterium]